MAAVDIADQASVLGEVCAAVSDLPPGRVPSLDAPAESSPQEQTPHDQMRHHQEIAVAGATVDEPWEPPTWEAIVEAHSARVYRLAYRLTGNPHDAEDLTQDVFIRVFRSLSTYTPGTFEGWLHRITTNLFLDSARRRQRIRFDALGDDAADRLGSKEPQPDRLLLDGLLEADVQAALDALPAEFRAAVVLCDIEGLSYQEIAATLNIKLGTVRSRIHRGRAQLRAALEHRDPARRQRSERG